MDQVKSTRVKSRLIRVVLHPFIHLSMNLRSVFQSGGQRVPAKTAIRYCLFCSCMKCSDGPTSGADWDAGAGADAHSSRRRSEGRFKVRIHTAAHPNRQQKPPDHNTLKAKQAASTHRHKQPRYAPLIFLPSLAIFGAATLDIADGAVGDHAGEEERVEPGERGVEAGD
jgi:hypothetical protein